MSPPLVTNAPRGCIESLPVLAVKIFRLQRRNRPVADSETPDRITFEPYRSVKPRDPKLQCMLRSATYNARAAMGMDVHASLRWRGIRRFEKQRRRPISEAALR